MAVTLNDTPSANRLHIGVFGKNKDNCHIILWMEFLAFFTCFRDTDNARENISEYFFDISH